MITYEDIFLETQTGLSHTFTGELHFFACDFRWFLVLIAQEVKIHRGSVPTALVYCSGLNLSSAKLYRQVNHSVGSFCNVRWFYDNLPNGLANWSVCWVFGVRIGRGEKTEPNCCLTSFQWAVISEDFLFTCPHNVILSNKNHKAIFTVGYAVNKVLLENWVKTGIKRPVRIVRILESTMSGVWPNITAPWTTAMPALLGTKILHLWLEKKYQRWQSFYMSCLHERSIPI